MKWKELYKIGITGSRKYPNIARVVVYCEKYFKRLRIQKGLDIDHLLIIHGGALGVDSIIQGLCARQGIKHLTVPARWLELDKRAGPHRNRHIVDLSNEVLAFWNGESPGTKSAIAYAQKISKPIKIFKPEKLKRIVKIVKEPVIYNLPRNVRKPQMKRLKQYIEDADLGDYLKER